MEVRNVAKLQVTSVFCVTYSLGVLLTSLHPYTLKGRQCVRMHCNEETCLDPNVRPYLGVAYFMDQSDFDCYLGWHLG